MMNFKSISELISNSAEGLPYPVLALILKIQKSLNEETGIIEIDSLQKLQHDMWVERVQGRKVEEIKKETIRSYLRTMHKCSRGLIQVTTSKDKKVQVFFPLVKKAYENFVAKNKEYSDTSNNKNKGNLEQARAAASQVVKTDTTQRANSSAPLDINKNKNININNKNKIYTDNQFPIQLDFTPSQATIDKAISNGLIEILSEELVTEFIKWNSDRQTQHTADYWQIRFYEWVENRASYNAKKQELKRDFNNASIQAIVTRKESSSLIEQFQASKRNKQHEYINKQDAARKQLAAELGISLN